MLAVVTIATGEWGVLSYPPLELPATVQPTSTGGGCSPEEEEDERKKRWERGEEEMRKGREKERIRRMGKGKRALTHKVQSAQEDCTNLA